MFAVVLLALLISVPVRAELRDPNNSADYIILTNQEVFSNNAWIDSLLDYRAAQGRVSMAVTVEEIWAEFTPEGSASAIREFLHYAYDNWQTPRLKDVFIVGHVDVVPTHEMHGIVGDYDYWSDYYFAVTDPTGTFEPRFSLGRLPWSPTFVDPLPNFLNKIETYESGTQESCSQRVLLIADSFNVMYQFEQTADSIANFFPEGTEFERDYIGRTSGDPDYGDRDEILSNLSAGPFAMFILGHLGGRLWLEGQPIVVEDFNALTNAPCYSIYSGFTNDDLGYNAVETTNMSAAVLSEIGGAIVGFSNSKMDWAVAGREFEYEIGQALASGLNGSINSVWNQTIADYLESNNVISGTSYYETLFTSILLGDPATIIPGRTTSADPIVSPVVPSTIQIVGNYPNPFNPSTTINFMLNRAGNARLTVYDITGRSVTTLAEQSFTAGSHSIVWNAAGLASGIYLVRLESAGQFDTHKITLLK